MADPTLEQLQNRLGRLTPIGFEGVVYRSSTPEYATETDLLTGGGARRHGGRWNPVGVAVVYASLTPETAMAETLAHSRYYGIPVENAMPRTFVAFRAKLAAVVDFREGGVRQRLRVSESRILTTDWRAEARAGREPITQLLGRACHALGLEGLIVPSATEGGGHNLLIFPDRLRPGSDLALVNPDALR